MSKIKIGNLNREIKNNPERKGWFVGNFIESSSPLHSKDLEVKWAVHKTGEILDSVRMNKNAKSLAVLIDGEFKFTFPDLGESYILEKKGDFIFWDAGVYHTTECIEDTTILTVRWPSLANDIQIK